MDTDHPAAPPTTAPRADAAADDLVADAALAVTLARQAGDLLLGLRLSHGFRDGLGKAGDAQANVVILDGLRAARPDDAVLSEESKDSPARLAARRVWIVDPLDGTREYGEEGRSDWAVHVALTIGGVPVAGAVALPGAGLVLSSHPAEVVPAPDGGPIRMLVSRTRPPANTEVLRAALDAELVPMGSAGAKAMAVVRGLADVYAHSGGQYEWDSAAPVAVARAAGLHVSRLDGSPLRYNEPEPYLPDLLICRPELAERVLSVVREA